MCSRTSKKIILRSLVTVLLAGTLAGGVAFRAIGASGGGHATNPGFNTSGGQCGFKKSPVPAYAWHDYCIGATWMYFSFDQSYPGIKVDSTYTATIADAGHMPGGKIGPCSWEEEVPKSDSELAKDKADAAASGKDPNQVSTTTKVLKHTSGFFRLGLVSYNPAMFLQTKNILASLQPSSKTGVIAGVLANNSLQQFAGNGGVPYLQIPGSLSFDDAHQRYNEAVASGELLSESLISWDGNLGGFCYDTSWSGGSNLGSAVEDIVTKPNQPGKPGETINTAGGHFYSKSTVSVPDQNTDVRGIGSNISNADGKVSVKLSTDSDRFTGDFHHVIYWNNDQRDGYYGAPSTTWSVTRHVSSSNGGTSSSTLSEGNTYQVAEDKGSTEDNSGPLFKDSYATSLAQGETVKVCYTIHYDPKYVSYIKQSGSNMHSLSTFSGDGSSTACYEVTRPKEPTTTPTSSPDIPHPQGDGSSSSNNGSIMYAGQESTIGWAGISAEGYPARRYAAYEEITYLVRDDINYYNGITAGNNYSDYNGKNRDSNDPCRYYRGKSYGNVNGDWPSTTNCAVMDIRENVNGDVASGTISDIKWDTNSSYFTKSRTVNFSQKDHSVRNIVPDYVGYKYCNAAGWKFEYWVGVDQDGEVTWNHKNNQDYWVTSNATCRTIAKKPSTAVWNGSEYTMTQGLTSSLTERYFGDNIYSLNVGQNASYYDSYGLDNYTFGSWAEYLTVVGGKIEGYASGAALARGLSLSGGIWPNGMPLTIANNNPGSLGQSSITKNESLYTRLNTFLRNRAETMNGNVANSSLAGAHDEVTETKIYAIKGDLTIDRDIVIKTSGYNNIYTIPRVVLFVDGNVKIASDVTQIDAWIIAENGNIDTCVGYDDATDRRNNSTDYSQGASGTSADTYNLAGSNCAKQLAFNGPVMAKTITLHRSYGADVYVHRNSAYAYDAAGNVTSPRNTNYYRASGNTNGIVKAERYTAAEIFNYRVDDYLWAYAQAGRYGSSYTESYSRELAPRY